MTAFLVAELIRQGKWSLDDPIALHLPPGTDVPRQGERQILVRDVLAHTSGLPALPPGFAPKNPSDPYADLSEPALRSALGQVPLSRPIGSPFEYSNFAMMAMSSAVARSYGSDYESALVARLFVPLKMDGACIDRPRNPRPLAGGHLPSGRPAQGRGRGGPLTATSGTLRFRRVAAQAARWSPWCRAPARWPPPPCRHAVRRCA